MADSPPEQLLLAAQEVINARIRVLKASKAQMPPYHPSEKTYANVKRKIAALNATAPEDVLIEYGWPT